MYPAWNIRAAGRGCCGSVRGGRAAPVVFMPLRFARTV